MFKVFYKYSACIKIKTDNISILCDPWFGDNTYYGTWTQFPEIKDKFELIGDFDFIYLSHIHPDHYCEQSIKDIIKKYPEKKIIITDWGSKPNYLKKKLIGDGLEKYIISNKKNTYEFSDTIVRIFPHNTNSSSDIDSFLIAYSKKSRKSVLNINDCECNQKLADEINSLKDELSIDISLLCINYTGAGPYPQTYYSPIKQKKILERESKKKKRKFLNRYTDFIKKVKSSYRLPFAGKYALKGDLSKLNKYRGVADALEVKSIDKNAVILADSKDAYFDIEKMQANKERKELYKMPEYIHSEKDYYWRTSLNFEPNESILKRLLITSINRAHRKSECLDNCLWSIYCSNNKNYLQQIWEEEEPWLVNEPLITFNCNKDLKPMELPKNNKIHSHLFIESKALFLVLTGIAHWNNYEVGSIMQVRRIPDLFDRHMQDYLNFLSVI